MTITSPTRDPVLPRIVDRTRQRVSPWVTLVAKRVSFSPVRAEETYHCLDQADYVAVLAQNEDGRFAIVRQYRPAVESSEWELPAGLLEAGESPAACCRRELGEEAGVQVLRLHALGEFLPDTGRLQNRLHAFFAEVAAPAAPLAIEEGIEVRWVGGDELRGLVVTGEFRHQLHLGVLAAAMVHGHYDLATAAA